MVIDECEAVAINGFGSELLARHKAILTELVARDKNHPSVFAWSLTNEPDSGKAESKAYFEAVAQHTRYRIIVTNHKAILRIWPQLLVLLRNSYRKPGNLIRIVKTETANYGASDELLCFQES
jgi:hypothetical protein